MRNDDGLDQIFLVRGPQFSRGHYFILGIIVRKHSPSEHVSVDESMIRFKGRTSLKQYNHMKPIRREYKLWCVADNDGYVYKFKVYTGKVFRKRALLKILI